MKKLISVLIVSLLFISVFALVAFAAEEPKITSNTVGYVDYTNGNNSNDGLTAATAKKQLMAIDA
ncbi:MAG: hypothetical protein IKY12_02415, partial [Clostridia bacterium]|nr:hypothetical protein [Clostridia bacterium]